MTQASVHSLRRIAFWQHHADGTMTVFPSGENGVPFSIVRMFSITGVSAGGRRGNHAHRGSSNILACLAGRVEVRIDDGFEVVTEALTSDGSCLLIPPLLWNSVAFEGPSTVLAVFCDELYDEADYLRDWDEYIRIKTTRRQR
jgi:dTDP-4-dehydrorhamnose 3,5-epimerase-like enzyme